MKLEKKQNSKFSKFFIESYWKDVQTIITKEKFEIRKFRITSKQLDMVSIIWKCSSSIHLLVKFCCRMAEFMCFWSTVSQLLFHIFRKGFIFNVPNTKSLKLSRWWFCLLLRLSWWSLNELNEIIKLNKQKTLP